MKLKKSIVISAMAVLAISYLSSDADIAKAAEAEDFVEVEAATAEDASKEEAIYEGADENNAIKDETVVEEDVDDVVEVSAGMAYGHCNFNDAGVSKSGNKWYKNGELIINSFFFDGKYTYFLQADGTPMKNYLTWHPDGEHLIYFDEYGHELFNEFKYCEAVKYICYFDGQGYLQKDLQTWNEYGEPVYLNANGKLENEGWFQFANGRDYGYAYSDGSLKCDGFDYDPWGRVVFYHWNGMVARGLISDYNYYYNMDMTDGHYTGKFGTGVTPVFNAYEDMVKYIVGVNIPAGEVIISPIGIYADCDVYYYSKDGDYYTSSAMGTRIITLNDGDFLLVSKASISYDVKGSRITRGVYTNDNGVKQYSYEARVGVHIPAGKYRVKMVDEDSEIEILTSTSYSINKSVDVSNLTNTVQLNRLYNRRFYHWCYLDGCSSGEYIEFEVKDGETLHVDYVGEIEYLGK